MTGRVTQIQRFSVHDGPGIRTTVFLKGCSLRCIWCHNPETYSREVQLEYFANRCTGCGRCTAVCPASARKIADGKCEWDKESCLSCFACEKACVNFALSVCGEDYSTESLCNILMKDAKYYANSGGGVTFSGGEPLLQPEFVFACADKLHELGVDCAVETSSNVPANVIEAAIPKFSLFMCDIKAMDSELHRSLTGAPNERILENIRTLAKAGADVLVRIPVAMGLNGTDENIAATAQFMKENGLKRIELLKLHHLASHKYSALGITDTYPDVKETTDNDIEHFYGIFREILGESMSIGL